MHVKEILNKKGNQVVTIDPEKTIARAVNTLANQNIGAIVVVDSSEKVIGLLAERDIIRGNANHGTEVFALRVKDLMVHEIYTCTPDDDIKDIMSTMTHRRVRHVPVVVGGKLIGIISIGDVVKNRLEETQLEVSVLRDYARSH